MLLAFKGFKREEKTAGKNKEKLFFFLETSRSTVLLFNLKTHLEGFSSACVQGFTSGSLNPGCFHTQRAAARTDIISCHS